MNKILLICILLFTFSLQANNTYEDLLNDPIFQTNQVDIINLSTKQSHLLKLELDNLTPNNINFNIIELDTGMISDFKDEIVDINDNNPKTLIYLEDDFLRNTVLINENSEDILELESELMQSLINNEIILNVKNKRIEYCENKKYINTHCIVENTVIDNEETDFVRSIVRKVYTGLEYLDILAYAGILKTKYENMELSKIFISIPKLTTFNAEFDYTTLNVLNNMHSFINEEGIDTNIYGNVLTTPKNSVYVAGFSYITNNFYNELFIDKNAFAILTNNIEVNVYNQEGAIYGCLNKDCNSAPVELIVNEEFAVINEITQDLNNIKVILNVSDVEKLRLPPVIDLIEIRNPIINEVLCKAEEDEEGNPILDELGNIVYDKEHLKLGTVTFSEVPENINCINMKELTNEYKINITKEYQEVYIGTSMPNLIINNPYRYLFNLTVGCATFEPNKFPIRVNNLTVNNCFKYVYSKTNVIYPFLSKSIQGDLKNYGTIKIGIFLNVKNFYNYGSYYGAKLKINGYLKNKGNIQLYRSMQIIKDLNNEGNINIQLPISKDRVRSPRKYGGTIDFNLQSNYINKGRIFGVISGYIIINNGIINPLSKKLTGRMPILKPSIYCIINGKLYGGCKENINFYDNSQYPENYSIHNYKDNYTFPKELFYENISDYKKEEKNELDKKEIEEKLNTTEEELFDYLLETFKLDIGNLSKSCTTGLPNNKFEIDIDSNNITNIFAVSAVGIIKNINSEVDNPLHCTIALANSYDNILPTSDNFINLKKMFITSLYVDRLQKDVIDCYTNQKENCSDIALKIKDVNNELKEHSGLYTGGFNCNALNSGNLESDLTSFRNNIMQTFKVNGVDIGKVGSCGEYMQNESDKFIDNIENIITIMKEIKANEAQLP